MERGTDLGNIELGEFLIECIALDKKVQQVTAAFEIQNLGKPVINRHDQVHGLFRTDQV